MDAPAFREVPGYDPTAAAAVIGQALGLAGGVDLVVHAVGRLPGSVLTEGRSGFFRSQPARAVIGQWRYTPLADGRLAVAHIVGGIVLGEDALSFAAAGEHVAGAIGQQLGSYGPQLLPEVLAMLEGLAVASS